MKNIIYRRGVHVSLAILMGFLVTTLSSANAQCCKTTVFFDDFESYPLGDIEARGNWLHSNSLLKWFAHGSGPTYHEGKFLFRGGGILNTNPSDNFVVLRLERASGFAGLRISFDHVLQLNERAMVEISPNGSTWMLSRASNELKWPAVADLSAEVVMAGIGNVLYVRLSAWDPTANGDWHWFAVDNLRVEVNKSGPRVTFVKAFTVDYCNLVVGSNYQLQVSADLITWINHGAAFTATSTDYRNTEYQHTGDWGNRYFRLQAVP